MCTMHRFFWVRVILRISRLALIWCCETASKLETGSSISLYKVLSNKNFLTFCNWNFEGWNNKSARIFYQSNIYTIFFHFLVRASIFEFALQLQSEVNQKRLDRSVTLGVKSVKNWESTQIFFQKNNCILLKP